MEVCCPHRGRLGRVTYKIPTAKELALANFQEREADILAQADREGWGFLRVDTFGDYFRFAFRHHAPVLVPIPPIFDRER